IGATLIDTYLDAADPDWFELASAEKQKRFGAAAPANMKEKARQVRFLQYRGFTQAQILAAIHAGERSLAWPTRSSMPAGKQMCKIGRASCRGSGSVT